MNDKEILEHIPFSSLPTHLGGTLQVNHLKWLEDCLKVHEVPHEKMKAFFAGVPQPAYMTARSQAYAASVEGE